jgi:hypothetical protein
VFDTESYPGINRLNRSSEINGNLMSKPPRLKLFKFLPDYFVALNLSLVLSLHLFAPIAFAQKASSRAYVIKAGFIYNFTRFIKWPSQSTSEENYKYNICVVGDNPFGSILHRLEEKYRLKEHPLKIRLDVSRYNFQGCHILFIGFSERFNVEQIVEQTQNLPIITLGDTEGFADRGVNINLLVIENKVQFEIGKQCLDSKGFRISSELLDLATRVVEGACQ